MIIECKSCHARFRLDESKIKGRGARVKCRKCGGSIVVLRDNGAACSPHDTGEGSLDLGSALRAPAPAGAAPPPDNLIPFPLSPKVPEHRPPEEKDEVDLAFDQLLAGTGESAPAEHHLSAGETVGAEVPTPSGEREPPSPVAEPPDNATLEPADPDTGAGPAGEEAPAPDHGKGDTPFEPAETALEADAPEAGDERIDLASPPEEPPAEEAATKTAPAQPEYGFLISDAETLAFLSDAPKEDARNRPGADISFSIAPVPLELDLPAAPRGGKRPRGRYRKGPAAPAARGTRRA
jgi:predicted Zn finger-like uncharacterized protein